jgi:hypothetical protein
MEILLEKPVRGLKESMNMNHKETRDLMFACLSLSAVGWDTTLQAGSSQVRFLMRSLDFSIGLILAAAQ